MNASLGASTTNGKNFILILASKLLLQQHKGCYACTCVCVSSENQALACMEGVGKGGWLQWKVARNCNDVNVFEKMPPPLN